MRLQVENTQIGAARVVVVVLVVLVFVVVVIVVFVVVEGDDSAAQFFLCPALSTFTYVLAPRCSMPQLFGCRND